MKQEMLKNLEKEIKVLITQLESEVRDLEESTKPVSPENAIGRISRMDAIQNISVVMASLRNRKNKLSKLRVSLSKVHQPGFGMCVTCKNPINPKRLLLLPESDKCIRCA